MITSTKWTNYAWQFKSIQKNTIKYNKTQLDTATATFIPNESAIDTEYKGDTFNQQQFQYNSDFDFIDFSYNNNGSGSSSVNASLTNTAIVGNLPRDIHETSLSSMIPSAIDDSGNENVNMHSSTVNLLLKNSNSWNADSINKTMIPTFMNSSNNGNTNSTTGLSSLPLFENSLLKLNNSTSYSSKSFNNILMNGILLPANCTIMNIINIVNKDFEIQQFKKQNPLKKIATTISNKLSSNTANPDITNNVNIQNMKDPNKRRDIAWSSLDSGIQSELKAWMGVILFMKPQYLSIEKMIAERKTLFDLFNISANNEECYLKMSDVLNLFIMNQSTSGPTSELRKLGYHYTVHTVYRKHFTALEATNFFGVNWNRDIRGNNVNGFASYDDIVLNNIIEYDDNGQELINYDNVKQLNPLNYPKTLISDNVTLFNIMPCDESFFRAGELNSLGFNLHTENIISQMINPSIGHKVELYTHNKKSIDEDEYNAIEDELLSEYWENDINNDINPSDPISSSPIFKKKHFISMSLRGGITYDDWITYLGLDSEIAKKLDLTTQDAYSLGWKRSSVKALELRVIKKPITNSIAISHKIQPTNSTILQQQHQQHQIIQNPVPSFGSIIDIESTNPNNITEPTHQIIHPTKINDNNYNIASTLPSQQKVETQFTKTAGVFASYKEYNGTTVSPKSVPQQPSIFRNSEVNQNVESVQQTHYTNPNPMYFNGRNMVYYPPIQQAMIYNSSPIMGAIDGSRYANIYNQPQQEQQEGKKTLLENYK